MYKVPSNPCMPTYENTIGLPQNSSLQQPGAYSPTNTDSPQQSDPIITMKKVRQCAYKGAEAVSFVLHKVSNIDDPYGASVVAGILAEVIDLVVLARANSKQLTELTDRALQVACILDKVKQAPKAQNELALAVEGFRLTLEFIQREASKYSGNAWTMHVMKVIKASGNEEKFEMLHKKLDRNLIAISACASVIGLVNQELKQIEQQNQLQGNHGAVEDKKALADNIDKILEDETNRLQKTLSQSTLNETEKNHILGLQLQSCITDIADMALEGKAKQTFIETQIKKLNQTYKLHTQPQQRKLEIEKHLLIPFYEVSINGNKIAQGGFGSIYLGQWVEIPVAVKIVGRQNEQEKQQFIREVKIMAELRNPYITQFYGCCVEPEACLIMEYMEQSSLDKVLSKKSLSDQEKKDIALCIAKGLLYLHTRGVLHRDLKTGNVLLNAQGQAKLTDFGLSKTLDSRVVTNVESSNDIQWQAPEIFLGFKALHTEESDIYSFGMVLWSICTGKIPFANFKAGDFTLKIKQGLKENIPNNIPEDFKNIIKACWNSSPELRPSLEDIISQLNSMEIQPQVSMEDLCAKGQLHQEKKEYSQALECFRLSAEGGYFRAQTNYATMLLTGQGCTENKPKAFRWMLKAAENGHDRAQYNVAYMLENGDGIPQNFPKAIFWYQEAAKKKFRDAAQKAQKLQEKSAYSFNSK